MEERQPPTTGASEKLQILATEHWSLLATRSLTYAESLGRVNMFLGILSGSVIALALIAQADRFGSTFIPVAILMLSVVLFAGVATVGRLMALNRDDYLWVVGMNRLRHAYLELHPELEASFTTSPYDDLPGALTTLGIEPAAGSRLGSFFHGFVTLPGMLAVIVAAVAGSIGGLAAAGFGQSTPFDLFCGAVAFVVAEGLMALWFRRNVRPTTPLEALEARFPTPKG